VEELELTAYVWISMVTEPRFMGGLGTEIQKILRGDQYHRFGAWVTHLRSDSSHRTIATGKSGTLGGLTVVGVCCPLVNSLTRSDT
jgi:hypothetical protein